MQEDERRLGSGRPPEQSSESVLQNMDYMGITAVLGIIALGIVSAFFGYPEHLGTAVVAIAALTHRIYR